MFGATALVCRAGLKRVEQLRQGLLLLAEVVEHVDLAVPSGVLD